MIPMMTKEEFKKVVEVCTNADRNCGQCPLSKKIYRCGGYLARYINENEPAPAATGTSSEVSQKEDTTSLTHLDDSTLLDICQEGLINISSRIAEVNGGDDYILGYSCAVLDIIKELRGGDGK